MLIDMVCDYCHSPFKKLAAEVKRQQKKGRVYFFCNLSCGAKWNNLHRYTARVEVEKICPTCNTPFKTLTGCKSPIYCSSSCASKGSMSENRRAAQRQGGLDHKDNLKPASYILKTRRLEISKG